VIRTTWDGRHGQKSMTRTRTIVRIQTSARNEDGGLSGGTITQLIVNSYSS